MASVSVVQSRWFKLHDCVQASALDFYTSVQLGVEARQLPDVIFTRVELHEAGPLSAKREYLRVRRGRLVVDVGAGQFGTGFFTSEWAGKLTGGPWLMAAIMLALSIATWAVFKMMGLLGGLGFIFLGHPLILIRLARQTPEELEGWDDPIIATPWIGPIYQNWFKPETRYKADTASAYYQSVHTAVIGALDQLTEVHGIRALSEAERALVRDGHREAGR